MTNFNAGKVLQFWFGVGLGLENKNRNPFSIKVMYRLELLSWDQFYIVGIRI